MDLVEDTILARPHASVSNVPVPEIASQHCCVQSRREFSRALVGAIIWVKDWSEKIIGLDVRGQVGFGCEQVLYLVFNVGRDHQRDDDVWLERRPEGRPIDLPANLCRKICFP